MVISAQDRDDRINILGSSDTPALFGVGWCTLCDLSLEKRGLLIPDDRTAPQLVAGHFSERGILDWAETLIGPIERDLFVPWNGDFPLAVHLDGRAERDGYPGEAKLIGPWRAKLWGEPGTDDVPPYEYVQCHAHMICTHTDYCHVPVLRCDTLSMEMYGVALDREFADVLLERGRRFWNENVLGGVLPNEPMGPGVARRVKREPGTRTAIDPELVIAWQAAGEKHSEAKGEKEAAWDAVLRAMLCAEGSEVFRGGELDGHEVTFFKNAKGNRQLRLRKVKR